MRAPSAVVLTVVIALVAACGGDDSAADITTASSGASSSSAVPSTEPAAAPSTEPAASAAPSTEPSSAGEAATEPPVTEPPVTEPPVTEPPVTEPPVTEPAPAPTTAVSGEDTASTDLDGSCLVGDWVVSQEQMNQYYAAVMSTVEAPLDISVVGSAPLSFGADGTYRWAPDFALTIVAAGQEGTGSTSGTVTGMWTAVDGVVTTASDVNALTVEVTVGGISFSGDDLANGLLDSSPINGVTYSCGDGAPVLDYLTADPAITVPMALAPA